jgi:hypothetical protein
MRALVLSLILVVGAGSWGYAQKQNKPQGLRGVYGPGENGMPAGQLGVSNNSGGSNGGIFGAGESGIAPATPGGIYGPGESGVALPSAAPQTQDATGTFGNQFLVPGAIGVGQALPLSVTATPMSDRPGYGTAVVNGRRVIINQSTNQISQFLN